MRHSDALPFRAGPDGVAVSVRLTPRASRTAVTGIAAEADGSPVLKAAVTSVSEAGKANAALVALLAKQWRIPKRSITIVAGATDRRKTLHVAGEPVSLLADLEAWAGHTFGDGEVSLGRRD